ncbi:hypothetical protein [Butyrivibrio fibrisolvens]|uniref:hypothetical protein n=1 Tax=Butyrivibrio fibrisolvens TaxID=831 RepID=UPI0003B41782|nr:hypothetical protein [Butyrivibrio fibrisolvens]
MANNIIRIWGIHSPSNETTFLNENFIALSWANIGDMSVLGSSRKSFEDKYKYIYGEKYKDDPDEDRNITMLWRFAAHMKEGDCVVLPGSKDNLIHIGRVVSDYYFLDCDNYKLRHRHDIEWVAAVEKDKFSNGARYKLGVKAPLFVITEYIDEFVKYLSLVDSQYITSKVNFPDEWTLRSETALLCAELIQKDYQFSEYVEVDGIKPYENKMENGASCVFEDLVTEWRVAEKKWIRRKDLEPESFKVTRPTSCMQILAFEDPNLNEEDRAKEIARWKRNKQFVKYRERTGTYNDHYFFDQRGPIKEPLIYTCIVWDYNINGTFSITDYVKSQLFKEGVESKEWYTSNDPKLIENDFFPATPIIRLEFIFVPGCRENDKKKIVETFCNKGKCNISIINLFDMAYSLTSPEIYNKLPDLRKKCFGLEKIYLPTNSMNKVDPSKKTYVLRSAYKDPQLNFTKHDGHMPDYSSIYTREPKFIEQYNQDDRRVWFVEEFFGRNDLSGHHFKNEKYKRQSNTYDPIVKAGYIGIDAIDPCYEDVTKAPAVLGQWLSEENRHGGYKFDPENICSLYLLRDVIKVGDIVVVGSLDSTQGIWYGEVTGDYEYLSCEMFKTPENMKKKVGVKFKNVRHVRKVKWIGSAYTIESGLSDVNQIFHEKVSSSIKELPGIADELQKSIMDGSCTYYMAVQTLDSRKIRFVSNENLRRSILGLKDYGGREYIGAKDSYVEFNKRHTSSVLYNIAKRYLKGQINKLYKGYEFENLVVDTYECHHLVSESIDSSLISAKGGDAGIDLRAFKDNEIFLAQIKSIDKPVDKETIDKFINDSDVEIKKLEKLSVKYKELEDKLSKSAIADSDFAKEDYGDTDFRSALIEYFNNYRDKIFIRKCFVSLSGFTNEAIDYIKEYNDRLRDEEEKISISVRLINGDDFIEDYLISYDCLLDKYREDIPLETFYLPSSDRVLCHNAGIRNGLDDFNTWNKAFDDNNAAIFDWQDFIKRSREAKAIEKQRKQKAIEDANNLTSQQSPRIGLFNNRMSGTTSRKEKEKVTKVWHL